MALDLSSAKSSPPPAKRAAKAATPQVSSKMELREEGLNGVGQLVAAGLLMFKQHADAGAVAKHFPGVAHETAAIAENNEGFAKVIDYITAVGPYAGLLTATMPLVLQIMVNHDRLPAAPLAQFGVVHPDALTMQVQADMMRQQAEIMAEQKAAQEEMARMTEALKTTVAV
jgi:hypothetical protein